MGTRDAGSTARFRTIVRPRLRTLLRGRFRIALLTAPAGYGKTTLARQLAAAPSTLWHRVQPEDADPAHLLGGLVRSGLSAKPRVGAQTAEFLSARRDFERDGALLVSTLAAELSGGRARRWIVLDDLHHLDPGSESIPWLRRWIEACDPRMRFVLTCRGDSPLPLQRFELEGGVRRIGVEELAFDEEESRRFLQAHPGAAARAHQLHGKLRGWPAGLALLALGGRPSAARNRLEIASELDGSATRSAADDESGRLFTFLAEEVFEPLDPDLRWALARSSLLETLEPAALGALLGAPGAARLARSLERRDLFVEWSQRPPRFHPLFHEYLRERFRRDPRAAQVRRAVPRLARRMAAEGNPDRAIRLLQGSGFLREARTLFDREASRGGVVRSSRLAALASSLASAAEHSGSPWIEYHGGSHAAGARAYDEAIEHYHRASALFTSERRWLEAAQVFRSEGRLALLRGQHQDTIAVGRQLVSLIPRREHTARGIVLLALGDLALHTGEPQAARARLQEAEALLARSGQEVLAADAAVSRATVEFTEGRWDLYLSAGQMCLLVYRRAGYGTRTVGLLINLASACIYLGRHEQAFSYLDEAKSLLEAEPLPAMSALEAMMRFHALAVSGGAADKQAQIAERELAADGSPVARVEFGVWRGVFERRRKRLAAAKRYLQHALVEAERIESPAWLALARMESALVDGLRGNLASAARSLEACARFSRRLGDQKELACNFLYQACLAQRAEKPFQKTLSRALRLLEREDHLIALRRERTLLLPIVEALAAASPRSRLLGRLAGAIPAESRGRVSRRGRLPALRLLGGFELRIGGRTVPLSRRAAEALIALLALRHGQPMTREAIGEALWPGSSPDSLRNRLDVTLSVARRALEPAAGSRGPFEILAGQSGLLHLDCGRIDVDLLRFQTLARAAEPWLRKLRRGTELSARDLDLARRSIDTSLRAHGGELLPGFADYGWLDSSRLALAEARRKLLLGAARAALLARTPEEALAATVPLIDSDPLDEDAHRLHFRALGGMGDRGGLVRRFRVFRDRLRGELQTEPSPSTVALVRSLLTPASAKR